MRFLIASGLLFLFMSLTAGHGGDPSSWPEGKDSLRILYHHQGDPFSLQTDTLVRDTSLFLFQSYDPADIVSLFRSGNGNIGGWSRLLDAPILTSPWVSIHSATMDPYFLNSGNLPVYRLHTPFTEASYSMGASKEQLFTASHAQHLGMVDAGITYRIISAPGDYINQRSKHDKWGFYMATSPELERFSSILSYTNNKIEVQENGGLALPSQFEDTVISNKRLLDVNLQGASSAWKASEFRFSNSYLLIGMPDSTGRQKPIHLTLIYDLDRKVYEWDYRDPNPDTSYYPAVLRDSSLTLDTIRSVRTTHSLGASLGWKGFIDLSLAGGLKLQHLDATVTGLPYDDWLMGLTLHALASKGMHRLGLVLESVDQGSGLSPGRDLQLSYAAQPSKNIILRAEYRALQTSLPLFALGWAGNHDQYVRPGDYLPRRSQQLRLSAGYKGISLEPSVERITNLYYLDDDAHPAWDLDGGYLLRMRLGYALQVKGFGMVNQLYLQNSPFDSLLGLPLLSGYHALWFHFPMFKGALMARAGLDLRYHSAYPALAYRADLGAFHVAPQGDVTAYLYADPWITLKIKTVRIFVKLAHANSGLKGNPYYSSPGYPMKDRSLVFGLSWLFYN